MSFMVLILYYRVEIDRKKEFPSLSWHNNYLVFRVEHESTSNNFLKILILLQYGD